MSSAESDDEAAEYQRLCEQFAEITSTDTARTQFSFQDVRCKMPGKFLLDKSALDESSSSASSSQANLDSTQSSLNTKTLKFITWNVDGLDKDNIVVRTKAVERIIINEQADIVFLQEVIPLSAEYFSKKLTEYDCLFGNDEGYFVGTFLKKSSISYSEFNIIKFPGTRMMRNALEVKATFGKQPLHLYNSHLESMAAYSEERKAQLKLMFGTILSTPDNISVLFGGDLNLRDEELKEMGGLPAGIEDLWITCGKKKEWRYTWDLTRNDNHTFTTRFQPMFRFDRVLARHSSPMQFKPVYFGLIGLQRLIPYQCFPSDHWGILCHFQI